jgi:hypothetical protein
MRLKSAVFGQTTESRFGQQHGVGPPLQQAIEPSFHRATDRNGQKIRTQVQRHGLASYGDGAKMGVGRKVAQGFAG